MPRDRFPDAALRLTDPMSQHIDGIGAVFSVEDHDRWIAPGHPRSERRRSYLKAQIDRRAPLVHHGVDPDPDGIIDNEPQDVAQLLAALFFLKLAGRF